MGQPHAISTGNDFGPFKGSGEPTKVLYVDGEMTVYDLIERLHQFDINSDCFYIYSDHYISSQHALNANLLDDEWRNYIKNYMLQNNIKLWILDNIASLSPGIDENSKQDWDPINKFFIDLRFHNIATIFIHHTNKEGEQRGTSGREDNLDYSIMLFIPKNYNREDGCRFITKFSKARVSQKDAYLLADTEFALVEGENTCSWSFSCIREATQNAVLKLFDEGMSGTEIAEILGISKGRVSQIKNSAIKNGLLTPEGKLTAKGEMNICSV
jgi:predicted XRE-type DNA-binding protein